MNVEWRMLTILRQAVCSVCFVEGFWKRNWISRNHGMDIYCQGFYRNSLETSKYRDDFMDKMCHESYITPSLKDIIFRFRIGLVLQVVVFRLFLDSLFDFWCCSVGHCRIHVFKTEEMRLPGVEPGSLPWERKSDTVTPQPTSLVFEWKWRFTYSSMEGWKFRWTKNT